MLIVRVSSDVHRGPFRRNIWSKFHWGAPVIHWEQHDYWRATVFTLGNKFLNSSPGRFPVNAGVLCESVPYAEVYLKRNAFRDSVSCDLNAIAFHGCEDNSQEMKRIFVSRPYTKAIRPIDKLRNNKASPWMEREGGGSILISDDPHSPEQNRRDRLN